MVYTFNLWQRIFYARKIRRLQQSFPFKAHEVLDVSVSGNSFIQITAVSAPYYQSLFVGKTGLRMGFMVHDLTEFRCEGICKQLDSNVPFHQIKVSGGNAVMSFRSRYGAYEVVCNNVIVLDKGKVCMDDDTQKLTPFDKILSHASENSESYTELIKKLKQEKAAQGLISVE